MHLMFASETLKALVSLLFEGDIGDGEVVLGDVVVGWNVLDDIGLVEVLEIRAYQLTRIVSHKRIHIHSRFPRSRTPPRCQGSNRPIKSQPWRFCEPGIKA